MLGCFVHARFQVGQFLQRVQVDGPQSGELAAQLIDFGLCCGWVEAGWLRGDRVGRRGLFLGGTAAFVKLAQINLIIFLESLAQTG